MSFEVKICGVNSPEARDAAIAAGADMLGFVSFAKSPRHLSPAAMADLVSGLDLSARKVLLTVDASDAELDTLVSALRPDLLQLHGDEAPERLSHIRTRYGIPIMKAISIRTARDLGQVPAYAAVSDRLLFDAKPQPGAVLPGGNGVAFDWSLLRGLDPGRPVMLSGGLDPSNVAQAVASVALDGVDVSSGVETAPGVKSPKKIVAFVEAARAARSS